jgi:hypothetical protein
MNHVIGGARFQEYWYRRRLYPSKAEFARRGRSYGYPACCVAYFVHVFTMRPAAVMRDEIESDRGQNRVRCPQCRAVA